MTQQTDYNAFEHPVPNSESTEDDDQWAPVLDALFEDQVDETIIKRGALSDRPPAGSSKDVANYPRLYLATDQTPPLLSYDNDTEWVDVNPFDLYAALGQDETVTASWTFDQEITGSIETATKYFGSVLYGGHSDFATAQAALDHASFNDYRTVIFPPGSYNSISIPNDVKVVGSGAHNEGTRFNDSVSGGAVVDMADMAALKRCSVANSNDGTGAHAILCGSQSVVEECEIAGAGGDGVNSNDANRCLITENVGILSPVAGNVISITSGSSDCVVTSNRRVGTVNNNGSNTAVGNNT